MEVWNEAQKEEAKRELYVAWHIGRFARTDFKFPRYEELFPKKSTLPANLSPLERGKLLRESLLAAFPPRSAAEPEGKVT